MKSERNRAWRRFKNKVNLGNGQGNQDFDKPEKKWKMMYFRSRKLVRAKQLGFEYPRITVRQLIGDECNSDE